jgi:hypothetical protein
VDPPPGRPQLRGARPGTNRRRRPARGVHAPERKQGGPRAPRDEPCRERRRRLRRARRLGFDVPPGPSAHARLHPARVLRRHSLHERGRDEQRPEHCDGARLGDSVDPQAGEGRAGDVRNATGVAGAGLAKDGTPISTWSGTPGLGFHFGVNPADPDGRIPQSGCCLYTPDVAVDTGSGLAWVGFHSNESAGPGLFVNAIGPAGPQGGRKLASGSVTGKSSIYRRLQRVRSVELRRSTSRSGRSFSCPPPRRRPGTAVSSRSASPTRAIPCPARP